MSMAKPFLAAMAQHRVLLQSQPRVCSALCLLSYTSNLRLQTILLLPLQLLLVVQGQITSTTTTMRLKVAVTMALQNRPRSLNSSGPLPASVRRELRRPSSRSTLRTHQLLLPPLLLVLFYPARLMLCHLSLIPLSLLPRACPWKNRPLPLRSRSCNHSPNDSRTHPLCPRSTILPSRPPHRASL
jgi:hypothetical protein